MVWRYRAAWCLFKANDPHTLLGFVFPKSLKHTIVEELWLLSMFLALLLNFSSNQIFTPLHFSCIYFELIVNVSVCQLKPCGEDQRRRVQCLTFYTATNKWCTFMALSVAELLSFRLSDHLLCSTWEFTPLTFCCFTTWNWNEHL